MPSVEIKAAVIALLEAAFVAPTGDGSLKHVSGHYPRASAQAQPKDFPQAYVWCGDHDAESLEAGGASHVVTPGPTPAIGLRRVVWDVTVHVRDLMPDPDQNNRGDAFDQIVDNVEMMLRQYPTLNAASGNAPAVGTAVGARGWLIEWSGSFSREHAPPLPTDKQELAYNAFVTMRVREQIRA